ncbi:MAG: hypothetical protein AB4352_27485 [Hormoscilla sp.]
MLTYEEVLSEVKRLPFPDQTRLLDELKTIVRLPVEVEGDSEELIPPEEIAESEAAWQDYLTGRDRGISSKELKKKLFGEKNG